MPGLRAGRKAPANGAPHACYLPKPCFSGEVSLSQMHAAKLGKCWRENGVAHGAENGGVRFELSSADVVYPRPSHIGCSVFMQASPTDLPSSHCTQKAKVGKCGRKAC